MNMKTTLILLFTAVLLGGVALYRLKVSPPTNPGDEDTSVSAGERILDPATFDPEAVDRIEVTRSSDGVSYVFEKRDDDAWHQTAPVAFRMQDWSIRGLATAAADMESVETIKAKELTGDLTPSVLGLEPPAATLVLHSGDADPVTIELGRIYVAGKAYVRLGGEDSVYVVGDDLHTRVLQRNPTEWRDKTVFGNVGVELSRLHLERSAVGDYDVRLHRVDGMWRMIEPVSTAVDMAAVDRLITRVSSASIRAFVSDAPDNIAAYGLDSPEVILTVETDRPSGDGEVETDVQSLHLGSQIDLNDKTRYAKRGSSPVVFTLNGPTIDGFLPVTTDLIAKTVVPVDVSNIRACSVSGEDMTNYRVERTLEGWQVFVDGVDDPVLADRNAVESMLAQLAKPMSRVDMGSLSEDEVLVRVSIEDMDSNEVALFGIARSEEMVASTGVDAEGTPLPGEPIATPVPTALYDDGTGVLRVDVGGSIPELNWKRYESLDIGTPAGATGGDDAEPLK